jgi:hypothetical protein
MTKWMYFLLFVFSICLMVVYNLIS